MNYAELLETNPVRAVEKAVKGMLPKNKLAAQQLKKLKVYAGPEHPHAAQQPKTYESTRSPSNSGLRRNNRRNRGSERRADRSRGRADQLHLGVRCPRSG